MEKEVLDLRKYNKIPKFIAVEGPIGVGKTTLASLLAKSLEYETFLENGGKGLDFSAILPYLAKKL